MLRQAEVLKRVPMFAKLESSKLKLLAFTSQCLTYDDGEELFHVGDPADCAYVILAGEVEILVDTEDGEVVALRRRANELIGELAILNSEPRSATVRANGHVMAMRIGGDMFLKLLSENPEVALDVMRQLSDKLARAHQLYEQVQRRLQKLESTQSGER